MRDRALCLTALVFSGLCGAAGALDVDFDVHLLVADDYLATAGSSVRLRAADNDANGLFEEDQLGMLSAILYGGEAVACLDVTMLAMIQNGYGPNMTRVETDLTVSIPLIGTINILDELSSGDPGASEALHNVLAGLMTIADNATITFVNNLVDELVAVYLTAINQAGQISNVQSQINFSAANYKTFGNAPSEPDYLGPAGDVDGDSSSNLDEYLDEGVRKDRETWLTDNCIDTSLRITSIQGGGLRISGLTEVFAVTTAGGHGTTTYEWWREGVGIVSTESTHTIDFLTSDSYPALADSGTYYCIIRDMEGDVEIARRETPSLALTVVHVNIFISQQPWGGVKPAGGSHTFTVLARGGDPGPYQFTWRRNGQVVGPNAASWTLEPLTVADAGSYTVSVTSNGGADTVSSIPAVLQITDPVPVVFTTHPKSAVKAIGSTYAFSVAVTGGYGTYGYDWRQDGVSLGAPNQPTLTINPVAGGDAGVYTCRAYDAADPGNTATSNEAQLTVVDSLVTIVTQPQGALRNMGDSYTFALTAAGGTGAYHYDWRKDAVSIGAPDLNSYSIDLIMPEHMGLYSCLVSDAAEPLNKVLSVGAALIVDAAPLSITTQPEGATRFTGQSYTFTTAAAGGSQTYHYDWRKEAVSLGAPDQPSLSIGPLTLEDGGAYSCLVIDAVDAAYSVLSNEATLDVRIPPLQVVTQPEGGLEQVGGSHTFTAEVTGGTGDYSYEWRKDGSPVPSAPDAPSYTIESLTLDDAGVYDCVITDREDPSNSTTSDIAVLAVGQLSNVVIETQPTGATKEVGESYAFTVSASGGTGIYHFDWRKDAVSLGAPDADSYEISLILPSHAGTYSCLVSDAADPSNNAMTEGAVLFVNDPPLLVIEQQPEGGVRLVGETHRFEVVVSGGTGSYHYNWRKDGLTMPDAADASVLILEALVLADSGTYTCVISDALIPENSINTIPVTLSVTEEVELAIVVHPQGASKYAGDAQTFGVVAEGGSGNYAYVWRKDGAPIPSAPDAADYTISLLALADAGVYSCVVSDLDVPGESATSSGAALAVAEHMSFALDPVGGAYYTGESALLSVSVSDGFPPLTYTWKKDGQPVSGAPDAADLTVGPLELQDAGAYACLVTDLFESLESTPAVLSVSHRPLPTAGVLFDVTLLGANVVPPSSSPSSGRATGSLRPEADKQGGVLSLTLFHNVSRATFLALFEGASGQTGDILLDFGQPTNPVLIAVGVTEEEVSKILSGGTYLEMMSEPRPGGDIRGQLLPIFPTLHTADQNGDLKIVLSELLRVIQFFNSQGYHCQAGSEDGYAPGIDPQTHECTPHSSDYNEQDWVISLSELLRLIQFFNSSGSAYHTCLDTEDGFCPGAAKDGP